MSEKILTRNKRGERTRRASPPQGFGSPLSPDPIDSVLRSPLSDNEETFRALVELLPQAVFRRDADGKLLFVNAAFCRLFEQEPVEILGRDDASMFPVALADRMAVDDREVLRSGETSEVDYDLADREGALLRVLRIPNRSADDEGSVSGFFGVAWRLSENEREREALEREIFLFKTLMDTIPDSVYFKDRESRFRWVNRYTLEKFGTQDVRDVVGKTDFDVFTADHASQAFRDEQEIVRSGRALVNVEERETHPDGLAHWVSTTKMPLRDPYGRIVGTFGVSRDITERKRAEEQLAQQAFYDPLTQLPNRALFMDRLDHLIRRARRRGGKRFLFAVVFLDLDRFKGVNDSMGHQAGDNLLTQIARRLETCIRPGDTLARLGGDEFTILLEDIRSEADAIRVAERIHRGLATPFNLNGTDIFSGASVGIALSSTGYDQPEDMLRDADIAMYRAKSGGRSRHEVFDSEMHKRAVALMQLETDLRRAIERNEFRVYYQPIVDLNTGSLQGFEALVRWEHPQRGLVMPDVFIPLAEETGLIGPIGLWVLRESCRQMRDWHKRFPSKPRLRISVNLSTRQLGQADLVDQVQTILRQTDLEAKYLILELTESALMQNLKVGADVIRQLHDLDVRLNIDDFGTGYSSLSYLQSFPVDTLKVDRSFVSRMNHEHSQSEIVRAIIALAQNLGMSVTAEGVETQDQVDALRLLNCKSGQGYFFARPMPALDVERLLVDGIRTF